MVSVYFVRGGLIALVMCFIVAIHGPHLGPEVPDDHPIRWVFGVMLVWGVVSLFSGAVMYALGPTS